MLSHVGKVTPVPAGLVGIGPIVKVEVTKPSNAPGETPPAGKRITASLMVDTGAQSTVIEDRLMRQLEIPPIRYMLVTGISQEPVRCPVYRARIILGMSDKKTGFEGSAEFVADIAGVPESKSRHARHEGLLGRDFLQHVRLEYDGPRGEFKIIDYRAKPPQPVRESPSGTKKKGNQAKAKKKRQSARAARKKQRKR